MSKQRISKVTTRAGDKGNTKLATGRTVAKHDLIVRCIGGVDELNSHIGVLTAALTTTEPLDELQRVQQALFDLGAVLAMEGQYDAPDATHLETATERLNAQLPPLTEFVLPGGGQAAAQAHVCRSVCRRAEVDLWSLNDRPDPNANLVRAAQYLNRLSDYFFVLARTLTQTAEQQWSGPKR